ncbi:MAG: hypothetical protein NTY36_16025 [Deltaproteobacteria bacterium]|nr:hypothetical protein [Deltaproteobacteria bacterium]
MLKLAVPKDDREYLEYLFQLKQEPRNAFLQAIQDPANISQLSDFTRIFQEITKVDYQKTDEIIRVLFTIYDAYDTSHEEIEAFASALVDAFKKSAGKRLKGALEEDFKSFHDFFVKILSLHDTIGVRTKALRLMPQHQHLFIRSELYSDIRPVFRPDNPSIRPSAAVIVHSLKIVYRENSETKDFYLGLDDEDLQQLKATIDRAISKHECLKLMISDFGIQCLGLESEE